MFIQMLKAGAAIALFLANVPLAASQIQAQDLAIGSPAQYQTVTYQTANYMVATTTETNIESGNSMSPLPESGTMAMLIAGFCMIGFAARRHKVAA